MNLTQASNLVDRTVTQLARLAACLDLADADAVAALDRWIEHRAKTGRPIGSAAAVLARMSDDDIRTDLGRYAAGTTSAARLCPLCRDAAGWIEDPDTGRPTARCDHHAGAVA